MNQDMPNYLFVSGVSKASKGSSRSYKSEVDNAETYGVASSSKSSTQIPKKDLSIVPEPGDNNAKKSIKWKSKRSQPDDDDNARESTKKEEANWILMIVNIKNKKGREVDRISNLGMQEKTGREANRILVIVNQKNKK